jgi:hypothetical protein
MREDLSARVVLGGQKRAASEGLARAGWRVDIGGDCTLEMLSKAARSLGFGGLLGLWRYVEKDCSRTVRLLRSAAFLGVYLRRNKWHFAAHVVQM